MNARALAPSLLLVLVACEKKSPEAAVDAAAPAPAVSAQANLGEVEAPEVQIAPKAKVHITWKAPPGTGINEDAPFKVRWERSEGLAQVPPEMKATGATVKEGFDVPIETIAGNMKATLGGTLDLVVCDVATHKVCVPVKRKIDLGFYVDAKGPKEAQLPVQLPEAKVSP